jgi:glycosyltransferase involved in cell wall biosynthesis
MRIGIEAQRIMRQKKHGMDIVALETLRHLVQQEANYEFLVYTQPDQDKTALQGLNPEQIRMVGPHLYPVWEQKYLPAAGIKDKIDLLHCTSNTAPVNTKIPLVVTIHDVIYLEKWMIREGSWYQRSGNLYRRWNVPRIAGKASMIITVSNYERERIIEHLAVPPDRVRTIYNGLGDHFTPNAAPGELELFKTRINLPERYILFLGNTDPKKNLLNVMKAMAILHREGKLDFKLVMPDFGKTALSQLLKLQDLSFLLQHIHLTGYIPNVQLPNLYRLASLFLYPSLRESFGLPILEAMACGTPVITSNTSAMPEIAGKDAILVNPHQPEELAAMISKVLSSASLRQSTIAYGLKRSAQFSWKKTAMETMNVYKEVLGK